MIKVFFKIPLSRLPKRKTTRTIEASMRVKMSDYLAIPDEER
jgi:hypothetical protein